ncbi:hypothetical protein QYF36_023988 [Acer negundo]|nr:hypothetical protein QYF36_023988 [Acer negundo]
MAEEISRETQSSIAASSMFPGFRFSPTDVELISYYLKKKMEGLDKCMEVIAQIEFCKYEPWDLLGTKRTLMFHIGRASKGEKTEWIMHEYCMEEGSQLMSFLLHSALVNSHDSLVICHLRKNTGFHLNVASNQNSARMHSSSYAVLEEGNQNSARMHNSSYAVLEEEQIESASESEERLADDANLTGSSSHNKISVTKKITLPRY